MRREGSTEGRTNPKMSCVVHLRAWIPNWQEGALRDSEEECFRG